MARRPNRHVTQAASELRIVLGQLVRRLRAQNTLPVSQATVLARLEQEGAQTASDLATAERMRPQSMAHTIKELETAALVTRRGDPRDGRRRLIELTEGGRHALTTDRTRRESWLANAISTDLTEDEQVTLIRAVELLQRLAKL